MEIRLEGITKSFSGKEVIKSTDLVVSSGSFTTLLGSSGCGKTTLLRMIAGLETPDSGRIFFDDVCIFSAFDNINVPPEKRGLGFVFQDFALWPHMSVFENVAFGLRARKEKSGVEEKVLEALRAVHLEEFKDRYPSQLSGGQQQRVSFARAIVTKPRCILFDEPFSALDAILRDAMRSELTSLISSLGTTAVFVTHDQEEAMSMSSRIAIIEQGRVVQYDTPENIYEHPSCAFSAHFVGKTNWIDDYTAFRPEKVSLVPFSGAEEFSATVLRSVFLGSCYRIYLSAEDRTWTISSDSELVSGSRISCYVDKKDILSFKEVSK